MSVATTTTNYGLPIFAGTDHGNWFDFNTGFQAIDTAIKAAATAAESAQTAAAAAAELANSASSLANSVNTNFTNLSNSIDRWTVGSITNSLTSKISNIEESAVMYNEKLKLLNIRGTFVGITGQSALSNDIIAQIQGINPPSGYRGIHNLAFYKYQDGSGIQHSYTIPGSILTTGQIQVNENMPSNIDTSKQWYIVINLLLCVEGWYD